MDVDKEEEKEEQEVIDIINEYNRQFDWGNQIEIKLQDMQKLSSILVTGRGVHMVINYLIQYCKPLEKSVFLIAPFTFAYSFHKLPFFNFIGKLQDGAQMKFSCDISGFYTYAQMRDLLRLIAGQYPTAEVTISGISNKSSKTCNWGTGNRVVNVLKMGYDGKVLIN